MTPVSAVAVLLAIHISCSLYRTPQRSSSQIRIECLSNTSVYIANDWKVEMDGYDKDGDQERSDFNKCSFLRWRKAGSGRFFLTSPSQFWWQLCRFPNASIEFAAKFWHRRIVLDLLQAGSGISDPFLTFPEIAFSEFLRPVFRMKLNVSCKRRFHF